MRKVMATVTLVLLGASVAAAHTPPRADEFSVGLDARGESAEAKGVLALKMPPSGRVSLAAGTFAMGSVGLDPWAARALCDQEPFGKMVISNGKSLCDTLLLDFDRLPQSDGVLPLAMERPRHRVTLDGFAIDRTEVSVDEYERCVAAGRCDPPAFRRGDRRFDQPNLPVTMVKWEDALAYCKWIGGRLPTEAEWEYAARGTEARNFPWGDVYNGRLCNHGSLAQDTTDGSDGFAGVAPVGSFRDGATSSGIFDLAGNVEEWVADRFEVTGSDVVLYEAAATNPFRWMARGEPAPAPGPDGGNNTGFGHYTRGGSYRTGGFTMRSAARSKRSFGTIDDDLGFRCVYEAP